MQFCAANFYLIKIKSPKFQNGHFFGMEMFSGHLYLHLDLGTGHVKIRVSQMRIDDGKWHNFHTERTKQYGKVTLDSQGNDFSLPGEAIHNKHPSITKVFIFRRC